MCVFLTHLHNIQCMKFDRLARGGEIGATPVGVDVGKDVLKLLKATEVCEI